MRRIPKKKLHRKRKWTPREATLTEYWWHIDRQHRGYRCAHWLFKRIRMVGHMQTDYKRHNSKALWVEVTTG